MCVQTTEELSRRKKKEKRKKRNPPSEPPAWCESVHFKSLSPGRLGYLCHITRCPIRAQQKGPESARLMTWKRERETDRWKECRGGGWTGVCVGGGGGVASYPEWFSWDFYIDLSCLLSLWLTEGEGGRQVRLSACVFNNGSSVERGRRARRGTDERVEAERFERASKETTTLRLHLSTRTQVGPLWSTLQFKWPHCIISNNKRWRNKMVSFGDLHVLWSSLYWFMTLMNDDRSSLML